MRWGINLRGDLAKLSDADIASRLETMMAERDALYRAVPFSYGNKWLYQRGVGILFGRGLLHARIFYRFYALQYLGSPLSELYLLDCELKDLRDEIKRRVTQKKAIPAM
jgi:hypothetical protein